MCNLYRMETAPDAIVSLVREFGRTVGFPDGLPNFQPRDVRITEHAPILRAAGTGGALELVERCWSWRAPSGKPVFNFRREGRRFPPAERCVVLADGFYEYTAPDAARARKMNRWLFTWPPHAWFGIAGIFRSDAAAGEAFTMLTCPPGPDLAPYHDRQVVVLAPQDCLAWLGGDGPGESLLKPLPAGSLTVVAA